MDKLSVYRQLARCQQKTTGDKRALKKKQKQNKTVFPRSAFQSGDGVWRVKLREVSASWRAREPARCRVAEQWRRALARFHGEKLNWPVRLVGVPSSPWSPRATTPIGTIQPQTPLLSCACCTSSHVILHMFWCLQTSKLLDWSRSSANTEQQQIKSHWNRLHSCLQTFLIFDVTHWVCTPFSQTFYCCSALL